MDEQHSRPADAPQPSEEELRAAYEEQLKRIRVEDVLVETVVSLLNLGGRKAGLAPETEAERDLAQVRLAIEATRALLPLVEEALGPDAGQVRAALSQLQLAYARFAGPPGEGGGPEDGGEEGGEEGGGGGGEPPEQPSSGPGPAESSGRLWVPGR
jgi:hypothetical protein